MGGLGEEGHEEIWEDWVRTDMRRLGKDEIWRDGAADRKQRKKRTERVTRQYFTGPSPLYSRDQGGRPHVKGQTGL